MKERGFAGTNLTKDESQKSRSSKQNKTSDGSHRKAELADISRDVSEIASGSEKDESVRGEYKSQLQEAIDYLSKTCTDDYIISHAENIKRLESIVKFLTKSGTGNCVTSQNENLKCLENLIKCQANDNKKSLNKTRKSNTSVENRKGSFKQTDPRCIVKQCKDLHDLCTSLKNAACQMTRERYPDEEYPLCSKTYYKDGNESEQHDRRNKSDREHRRSFEEEENEIYNKRIQKQKKSRFIDEESSDKEGAIHNKPCKSRRPSCSDCFNDEDDIVCQSIRRNFFRDASTDSFHKSSSKDKEVERKRSNSFTRRSNSIQLVQEANQNIGGQNNTYQCVPISMFSITLVVLLIMVLSILLFSSIVIMQYKNSNTMQIQTESARMKRLQFERKNKDKADYNVHQCSQETSTSEESLVKRENNKVDGPKAKRTVEEFKTSSRCNAKPIRN